MSDLFIENINPTLSAVLDGKYNRHSFVINILSSFDIDNSLLNLLIDKDSSNIFVNGIIHDVQIAINGKIFDTTTIPTVTITEDRIELNNIPITEDMKEISRNNTYFTIFIEVNISNIVYKQEILAIKDTTPKLSAIEEKYISL